MPIPELGGVVASALAEVLATQFKLPVIASDTPSADQSEQCLIGTVKLTGELLSGDVRLELPEAFVAMITAALHESGGGAYHGRRDCGHDRRALQHVGRAHRCDPGCKRSLGYFERPHSRSR